MARLKNSETKTQFLRQVSKVHQSDVDGAIFSYCVAYIFGLDGECIGFCDMFNDDAEIQYSE